MTHESPRVPWLTPGAEGPDRGLRRRVRRWTSGRTRGLRPSESLPVSGRAAAPLPVEAAYRIWAESYDEENPLTTLDRRAAALLTPPLAGRTLLDAACGTARRLTFDGIAGPRSPPASTSFSRCCTGDVPTRPARGRRPRGTSARCRFPPRDSTSSGAASRPDIFPRSPRSTASWLAFSLPADERSSPISIRPRLPPATAASFATPPGKSHLVTHVVHLPDAHEQAASAAGPSSREPDRPPDRRRRPLLLRASRRPRPLRARPGTAASSRAALPPMKLRLVTRRRTLDIEAGRIVSRGGVAPTSRLDLDEADARPGLVNAHDHLHRNHLPRLGSPPYADVYDWGARAARPLHKGARAAPRDPARAGAPLRRAEEPPRRRTTAVHHDPWEEDFDRDFPIRVPRIRDRPLARARRTSAAETRPGRSYGFDPPRGGDGRPRRARRSGRRPVGSSDLSSRGSRVGDRRRTGSRVSPLAGCAVVWCPTSNLVSLRPTAPARSSPGPTSSSERTRSSRAPGRFSTSFASRRSLGSLSDSRLEAAVTDVAARRLGLPSPSLEPGAPADIVVLRGLSFRPARATSRSFSSEAGRSSPTRVRRALRRMRRWSRATRGRRPSEARRLPARDRRPRGLRPDARVRPYHRVTMPDVPAPAAGRTPAPVPSFYDDIANDYDTQMSRVPGDIWTREAFQDFVTRDLSPGEALLDFGCGTGIDAMVYAERGFRVIGYDSSPAMIQVAVNRCGDRRSAEASSRSSVARTRSS